MNSRRRTLILVAILAAFFGSFAPQAAQPARAAVHNPIPADASENPNDAFDSNDSLWAWFTSDLAGGRICVVAETGPGDCDRPEMGAVRFIGATIGLAFTLIKKPSLEPGTFRLLTENSIGDPIAYSIPFHVADCGNDCPANLDMGTVQRFKDAAGQNAFRMEGNCEIHGVLESVAGKAIGMRGQEHTLTYGDGQEFIVQDPATAGIRKALDILSDVSCGAAKMFAGIHDDPPDANFGVIAQPEPRDLGLLEPPTLGNAIRSIELERALAEATLHAFERYQGALAAGNAGAQVAQLHAAGDNAQLLAHELDATARALRSWAAEAATDSELSGPILTSANAILLASMLERVELTGFTAGEVAQFHALGYTDAEIAAIRLTASLGIAGVPTDTSYPEAVLSIADDLEATVEATADFASEVHAFAAGLDANEAPVASFSASALGGSAPLAVEFQSDSTDTNGDPLTLTWDFGDGATDDGASVSHTYAAAGTYTATLIASDGRARDSASTTIVVSGNRAPRVWDDLVSTAVNTDVAVDVLTNDSDADGDALMITEFDALSAGGGTVTCASLCTYSPPVDMYGTDLFRYAVSDGAGGVSNGTVRVTISTTSAPLNAAPTAQADTSTVQIGESAVIPVLANDVDPDGDPLTVVDFDALSALGASVACASSCTYEPPAGTYGRDVFSYTISDGQGGFAAATVAITIAPPTLNQRPTAVDDDAATVVDQAVIIDVVANDEDFEGNPLHIIDWDVTSAGGGHVSGGTRLSYTPPPGLSGSDQFTYRVSDGQGGTDVGLVTVTITHPLPGAAAFTVHPPTGFAPLPVRFDATASADPEIASFDWDFGDGTSASGRIVSHTYLQPGGYQATLTITDTEGRTDTETKSVDVRAASSLAIPVCGDAGTAGEPIVFRCPAYSPVPSVQSFQLGGSGPVDVRFDYVLRASIFGNELAVFTIDDALGTVAGLSPGDAGYLRAALTRARVIFGTGTRADAPDATLEFEGGDRLVFVVIPDGTLSDQLARPDDMVGSDVVFSMDRLNPDGGIRHLFGFRHAFDGSVQLGFEDILGDAGGDFDDIVFNAHAAFRSAAPLAVAITADASSGLPGSTNGYDLTVANPLATDVEVAQVVDVLPEGFAYEPGSSSGVTTADPSVIGRVLRWVGPFTVPSGELISLHFGVTLADGPGTYLTAAGVVSAVAATGSGLSAPIAVLDDDLEPTNTAPDLPAIADQTTPEEVAFEYALSATDPDPDQSLTFELASGPAGVQVTPAGTLTWTPTEAQGPDSHDVTVRVVDNGTPSLSDETTFSILVTEANRPPVLDAIDDVSVHPGEPATFTATASDPDLPANTRSYSMTAGPSGAAIDATTGVFSWTPALANLGDHPVTVSVSDGHGGSADRSITIHVFQDATTLTLEGASAGQYSDQVTIGARLTPDIGPIAGATISISLGVTSVPSTTDATGLATAAFTLPGPAGSLPTSAAFAGTPSLTSSTASGSLVQGREDATLVYSGATIGLTGATLDLSATFADSASTGFTGANPETTGGTVGDITNARVAFAIWPAASCLTGPPLVTVIAPVVDTGPAGDGIGRAGASWSSNAEGSFCVAPSLVGASGTGVNAHYAAPPADPAGLAVYADAIGKVTGGGWIGLADGRANFGFNASSLKGRVKGNLVFIVRTTFRDARSILVIRSNAIEGLRTSGSTVPVSVVLTGRASFKYVSAIDGSTLFESGNATFTATVVDAGNQGSDTFALRAFDKSGAVLVDIGATTLGGGNVVAHLR